MHNIYDLKRPKIGQEEIKPLFKTDTVLINQILSHQLERSAWYQQKEDEWLVLIEGEAVLEFENKMIHLKRGDTLLIPAQQRHRVLKTSTDALWLTVHMDLVSKQK